MFVWLAPVPVAVLAFVTTVHATFVVLRRHRSVGTRGRALLLAPALVFAASPWVIPTIGGLAAGLAAQLAWFIACEKLAPTSAAQAPPASAAAPSLASRHSREFVPVRVLATHDESPTIRTFRLTRPSHFDFVAGQFLTVRVDIDGRAHARCYSISSSPHNAGYLEISVRRQGLVSNALHGSIHPGSVLFVKPPAGRFVYPAGDARPLVLLAGGVGITPVLSMLRYAVSADPARPVTLILSSRSGEDVPFADELALLAARHPQVRIVITLSGSGLKPAHFSFAAGSGLKPAHFSFAAGSGPRPADDLTPAERKNALVSDLTPTERKNAPVSDLTPGNVPRGHIDGALVREVVTDPAGSLFYVCGPTPMMEAMRALLLALGVPAEQVRTEVFQPAAAIGARAATPTDASAVPRSKVACTRSNRTFEVIGGATLLDAAETAGIDIPSLCRSGVCGTCKTRLVSGEVRCTSDALDEQDRAEGYILPCVSWPSGDCALEV